jgi:hypothetical protein
MVDLTLIEGDAVAEFSEHPTEVARRALFDAANVETPEWSALVLRFASALPDRRPRKVVA